MPMSKKQLEKKQQAKKAELAELEKQAAAGDGEAKKKIAKLKKKMKGSAFRASDFKPFRTFLKRSPWSTHALPNRTRARK